MASTSTMDQLPPFPDNLLTAPIARISYEKLLAANDNNNNNDNTNINGLNTATTDEEAKKVLEACRRDGFFYLDLSGSAAGQQLLKESEQILSLARTAFSSPLATKTQYANERGRSLFGYKAAGTVKQTDRTKRPDTTEFFNVAKDHVHEITESRTYPPEIRAAWPLIRDFTRHAHECGMLVLEVLARQMGLPSDEFTRRNEFSSPSGDHVRMTKKVPHDSDDDTVIGLPSHTDFGSITVLFNWLGGLQIQNQRENQNQNDTENQNQNGNYPAKDGEWAYVRPLPNHAVINLGDAMVKFTNGALRSAKHRVVPAPGPQASIDRYSVVYFVRPADDVMMEPVEELKGESVVQVGGKVGEEKVYTAGEWMIRRLVQLGS